MKRLHRKQLGVTVATLLLLGCEAPEIDHVAEVTALLEALPVAWNARDASMWVANFAPSSDFTNILGIHFEDRAANEARHTTLLRFAWSAMSVCLPG
jgi:hypothetical protein